MFEHLSITTLGNSSCGLMYIATLVQLYSSCMEPTIIIIITLQSHTLYCIYQGSCYQSFCELDRCIITVLYSRANLLQSCSIARVSLPTKHFAATLSTVNSQEVHLHICTRSDRSGVKAKVSPFFPSYE